MSKRRHRMRITQLKLKLARAYPNGVGSFKANASLRNPSNAFYSTGLSLFRG